MASEFDEEAERAMHEALDKAWSEYENASEDDKKAAKERYLALLRSFSRTILGIRGENG